MQHASEGSDGLLCGCAGAAEVVVAGGMESMSRVPYYATGARAGLRMGHAQLLDGMLLDGLWRAPAACGVVVPCLSGPHKPPVVLLSI
jgi:hypothetical protein